MAVIAVIATLDTKGAEAAFLKQTIEKMGCSVLLIDSGMGAAPTITPDLARDAVFAEAGVSDCRAYLAEQGKAATQDKMREGLQKTLRRLQGGFRAFCPSAAHRALQSPRPPCRACRSAFRRSWYLP